MSLFVCGVFMEDGAPDTGQGLPEAPRNINNYRGKNRNVKFIAQKDMNTAITLFSSGVIEVFY